MSPGDYRSLARRSPSVQILAALHPSRSVQAMTGAGKNLAGGGARRSGRSPAASAEDGGYPRRPHPTRVKAGQRFVARRRRRHRALVICACRGVQAMARLEGAGQRVSLSTERLLAVRSDGQGRYFQFLGWRAQRYRTWAVLAGVEGPLAVLVVPEWHPVRPVRFPARLLPAGGQARGVWLSVVADLSAASPGRLNIAIVKLSDCPAHLCTPGQLGCK